jgi:hypothetical protein
MYEHRYKYGKQKALMTVENFREKLEISQLKLEYKAFLVLLWHSGARKSEAYERTKDDIEITDMHVVVDFHQRKKHGDTVPPLKIPRRFYGVEEYVLPYLLKPKRTKEKTLYTYETKEEKLIIHTDKKGGKVAFSSCEQHNSMANMQEGSRARILSPLSTTKETQQDRNEQGKRQHHTPENSQRN